VRLKRDGTRAETRFLFSPKRTSPFKLAGASVQSTAGSRDVRISGSNAGYTMFRGSVKSTGYPLHSPVSPSLPLPCVTVRHRVSNALYLRYSMCFHGVKTQHASHATKATKFDSTANQVNPITCWLPEVSSNLLLQQFPFDLQRTAFVSRADRCQTEDLTAVLLRIRVLWEVTWWGYTLRVNIARVPLCFSGEALSHLSRLFKVTVTSGEHFLCLCKLAPHSLSAAT